MVSFFIDHTEWKRWGINHESLPQRVCSESKSRDPSCVIVKKIRKISTRRHLKVWKFEFGWIKPGNTVQHGSCHDNDNVVVLTSISMKHYCTIVAKPHLTSILATIVQFYCIVWWKNGRIIPWCSNSAPKICCVSRLFTQASLTMMQKLQLLLFSQHLPSTDEREMN